MQRHREGCFTLTWKCHRIVGLKKIVLITTEVSVKEVKTSYKLGKRDTYEVDPSDASLTISDDLLYFLTDWPEPCKHQQAQR